MTDPKEVARVILDDVFCGELKPGDAVVESHYKSTLKISRATFQQATINLEALGYVVISENKSPRIISPSASLALEAIEYRLREECEAIETICSEGLTDSALDAFEWSVSTVEETEDPLAFNKADAFFHQSIMNYGKKKLGSRYVRLLHFVIFTHMKHVGTHQSREHVAKEHRQILNEMKRAVKEKEPGIASDELRKHLLETKQRIQGIVETESRRGNFEDYANRLMVDSAYAESA